MYNSKTCNCNDTNPNWDTLTTTCSDIIHKDAVVWSFKQRPTINLQRSTSHYLRATRYKRAPMRNEGSATINYQQTKHDEPRATTKEELLTNGNQRAAINEQWATNNDEKTTNNDRLRLTTSSQQRATIERRARSNEQQLQSKRTRTCCNKNNDEQHAANNDKPPTHKEHRATTHL